MLLKPLTDALALVSDRIRNFEHEFTNNEQQTRLSLVDPVLKALDWDPQDPTTVRVEYPVRQRNRNNIRADYALLSSSQEPVAFVEAKKLRSDLGDAHLQLFEYAVSESVPYSVATNGADWAIYKRVHQETGLLFQRLLRISILDRSPKVTAIMLLPLWKELLTSHSSIDYIAPALSTLETFPPKNTLQTKERLSDTPLGQDQALHQQPSRTVYLHDEPTPVDLGTTTHHIGLSDCETFTLNNPPIVLGRKPSELILPDGTKIPIKHWTSLLKEVVMWLFDNDQLNVELPWKGDRNFDRNVLQETPFRNRNGAIYKQQVKIEDDLYLLTNYNARNACNAASKLLADCGIDNSQAQVTMASQNK